MKHTILQGFKIKVDTAGHVTANTFALSMALGVLFAELLSEDRKQAVCAKLQHLPESLPLDTDTEAGRHLAESVKVVFDTMRAVLGDETLLPPDA